MATGEARLAREPWESGDREAGPHLRPEPWERSRCAVRGTGPPTRRGRSQTGRHPRSFGDPRTEDQGPRPAAFPLLSGGVQNPPATWGYTLVLLHVNPDNITAQMPDTIEVTWVVFADDRCVCHRQVLIAHYYPLVKRVAGKMWRSVPSTVDLDDMVSYGVFGLIRALDHYSPERGVVFETYAVAAIRSLILDELRSQDWAPRSLRRRQREVDQTVSSLEAKLGRRPSTDEVANVMGLTREDVFRTVQATDASKPRSLDERLPSSTEGDGQSRYEHVADRRSPDPLDLSSHSSVIGAAVDVLESLPPQELAVVCLYYYEGMTLRQAGEALGIPESRASQLHTSAMMALRSHLTTTLQPAV